MSLLTFPRKMPKKRRVPEVLWRLFRHRARTLASTIVSLVPPLPPSSCSCSRSRTGSQCLSCSGSEAMSFLVRKEDPQEYVKLLNKCFVVVSENAPPLSRFQSHSRWPQSQVHLYAYTYTYVCVCVCVFLKLKNESFWFKN